MSANTGPVFTADRYTSVDFLEGEKQEVFRNSWLVAARESEVARPGDRLAFDELDESAFLVRGEDGVVRGFRNACRHRGMRLVSERCRSEHIRCKYHGWTYGLDGRLKAVPKEAGFAHLDRATHGLTPVRAECWAGFVWITFGRETPPLAQHLGALASQLEPYRLEEMHPLLRRSWTLPCNWKAVLDQATESYHLRSVHGETLSRLIDESPVLSRLGDHNLQTVPVADHPWRKPLDRLSVPAGHEFTPDQLHLFHKYMVFPNTLLNVMPYHLTVFRVFPVTPDSCRLHYEFHVRKHAGLVARLRGWLTLLASLYILRQDLVALPLFQSGIKAAGSDRIRFHREEAALEHFHSNLDRHLNGRFEGNG